MYLHWRISWTFCALSPLGCTAAWLRTNLYKELDLCVAKVQLVEQTARMRYRRSHPTAEGGKVRWKSHVHRLLASHPPTGFAASPRLLLCGEGSL